MSFTKRENKIKGDQRKNRHHREKEKIALTLEDLTSSRALTTKKLDKVQKKYLKQFFQSPEGHHKKQTI